MLALRYVYILALAVWFGGIVSVGLVSHPASAEVLHRVFVISCTSAGLLLLSLSAMGLLGPRPSEFAARFGVAAVMLAATLYSGSAGVLPGGSRLPLIINLTCGLVLFFWEARDGIRAA